MLIKRIFETKLEIWSTEDQAKPKSKKPIGKPEAYRKGNGKPSFKQLDQSFL